MEKLDINWKKKGLILINHGKALKFNFKKFKTLSIIYFQIFKDIW